MSKVVKKLSRYDAVIIDDIGYVQHSRRQMEVLFTFLADGYERGRLMITSNLPFSKWQRIFKDPMNAAVAIDRLVHHSKIVELNIESYRMQVAKKNKRKKPDGPAKGSKSVGFG
jgi:DNA replication protein DnaC